MEFWHNSNCENTAKIGAAKIDCFIFCFLMYTTETEGLATPTVQRKAGVGCIKRGSGGVWPSVKRLKSVSVAARSCFVPDCLGGG